MQRSINAALFVSLTVFVTAVSLALLGTAVLMASYLLNGPTRTVWPKGLFVGLLAVVSFGLARAQAVPNGAFMVVEERTTRPDGQLITVYSLDSAPDSLPMPVRMKQRSRKRLLSPKPVWSDTDLPVPDRPDDLFTTEPTLIHRFYNLGPVPSGLMYKPELSLGRHPW